MSKIAIPVKDNLLSRSFNACRYFLVYDIVDNRIVGKKVNFFVDDFRTQIADWAEVAGITDVVVHHIDEISLNLLTSTRINLFVGVKISDPDRLVEDFLNGDLQSDTKNILEKCSTI